MANEYQIEEDRIIARSITKKDGILVDFYYCDGEKPSYTKVKELTY
jgi:hypothetical protein